MFVRTTESDILNPISSSHPAFDSRQYVSGWTKEIKFVTYRIFIFHQALVIAAKADKEKYASNILEAMYPFSPFALLTTNINH